MHLTGYDEWLMRPYTVDNEHYVECAFHEDKDSTDNDECSCDELDADAKAEAEDFKFESQREAEWMKDEIPW